MEQTNIVSKLLAYDRSDIERKKTVHKMALSKLDNVMMEFELRELTAEEACAVKDKAITMDQATGEMHMHSYAPAVKAVITGCPSVFYNNDVRKHFGCETFEALVNLLLTSSELEELSDKILELSDLDLDETDLTDRELKNS